MPDVADHLCTEPKSFSWRQLQQKIVGRWKLSGSYTCASCAKKFDTICTLHYHCMRHSGGGSYFFDHVTSTAYPKLDTVCSSSQFDERDLHDDSLNVLCNNENKAEEEIDERSAVLDGGTEENRQEENDISSEINKRIGAEDVNKPQTKKTQSVFGIIVERREDGTFYEIVKDNSTSQTFCIKDCLPSSVTKKLGNDVTEKGAAVETDLSNSADSFVKKEAVTEEYITTVSTSKKLTNDVTEKSPVVETSLSGSASSSVKQIATSEERFTTTSACKKLTDGVTEKSLIIETGSRGSASSEEHITTKSITRKLTNDVTEKSLIVETGLIGSTSSFLKKKKGGREHINMTKMEGSTLSDTFQKILNMSKAHAQYAATRAKFREAYLSSGQAGTMPATGHAESKETSLPSDKPHSLLAKALIESLETNLPRGKETRLHSGRAFAKSFTAVSENKDVKLPSGRAGTQSHAAVSESKDTKLHGGKDCTQPVTSCIKSKEAEMTSLTGCTQFSTTLTESTKVKLPRKNLKEELKSDILKKIVTKQVEITDNVNAQKQNQPVVLVSSPESMNKISSLEVGTSLQETITHSVDERFSFSQRSSRKRKITSKMRESDYASFMSCMKSEIDIESDTQINNVMSDDPVEAVRNNKGNKNRKLQQTPSEKPRTHRKTHSSKQSDARGLARNTEKTAKSHMSSPATHNCSSHRITKKKEIYATEKDENLTDDNSTQDSNDPDHISQQKTTLTEPDQDTNVVNQPARRKKERKVMKVKLSKTPPAVIPVRVRKKTSEVCKVCGKAGSRSMVKYHEQLHSDKLYKCDVCGKELKTLECKRIHMQTHEEKKWICDRCPAAFYRKHYLETHMNKHNEFQPYMCDLCGKKFAETYILRRHIDSVHNNIRRYECDMCKKAFFRPQQRDSHRKRHFEATLQCSQCPKKFHVHNDLIKHEFTHTGEKQFFCCLCNKGFVQIGGFYRHMKNIHFIANQQAREMMIRNPNVVGMKIVNENYNEWNFQQNGQTVKALSERIHARKTVLNIADIAQDTISETENTEHVMETDSEMSETRSASTGGINLTTAEAQSDTIILQVDDGMNGKETIVINAKDIPSIDSETGYIFLDETGSGGDIVIYS